LRAVARGTRAHQQFWEPPGSSCCSSLLAGGFWQATETNGAWHVRWWYTISPGQGTVASQPQGRSPPPPPSCGHRPDRAPGTHQAHAGLAWLGPDGPIKPRQPCCNTPAAPSSLPYPSYRLHLQRAPRSAASWPAQAHLRPRKPRSGPSGRRWPPPHHGALPHAPLHSATAPLPLDRAGPESPEEHCRHGLDNDHTLCI
jgi:hypothetical protein